MRFLRLGPSGMRGAVGSALTGQLAIKYASAFGTWLDGGGDRYADLVADVQIRLFCRSSCDGMPCD